MATTSINRDDRSPLSRELFPVLLRIHYPPLTPPSTPHSTPSVATRQPFENGIKLRTTITTVSALLNYLQYHDDPPCMAPLDVSEYLDPNSLHIVWKSELKMEDTYLNDENVRTQMANVWLHDGGDELVVAAKKRERSQEGAGAEPGSNERPQVEFNRDESTCQVPSTLAADAPDFRSSSTAITAASSRRDETAGMEDVRFTDSSSRPSESGSSYNPVRSEIQTWGGAPPTNAAPISSSSHAGSDTFDIPAARSEPKSSIFTHEPDPGNNETWCAYTPSSSGRGGQQRRSDPKPPGFWKPGGGWDSEAAARAGGPAATSTDFSFGPSRPAGDRTAGFGAQYRPVSGPPSPPPKQRVWSDDTLGDRPKNLPLPEVPIKRSIFPPDRGAKPLSESRWATEEDPVGFGNGIHRRGVQGQSNSFENQNRAQGNNQSWGSSWQQPNQNREPLPQQGSWNPTPTPNQSQFQSWESERQSQQWDTQGHGQGQGQDSGNTGEEGQWDSGGADDQSLNSGRSRSKNTRNW